jgi:hypothetical protein
MMMMIIIINLNDIYDVCLWGGMDWIDLAQDRVQWRDLVDKVMNIRVP